MNANDPSIGTSNTTNAQTAFVRLSRLLLCIQKSAIPTESIQVAIINIFALIGNMSRMYLQQDEKQNSKSLHPMDRI